MSGALRLAFVCPRLAAGDTVGGAETLLKALARRARAAGREVTFLTTCARDHFTWRNEWLAGRRSVDGLDVIFFPVDEDRDVEAFLDAQGRISRGAPITAEDETAWLTNSVNSRALCEHLDTHGDAYDRIVMGPYLFGLVHAASLRHPGKTVLVPCLHDEPFARLESFRKMFLSVHACMFNTEPERDLAVRLYGVSTASTAVVGLGLDPFEPDPDAFRTARPRLGDSVYVLYSGRREPLKGTPLLLDYLAAFRARTRRDLKLVLTGSGEFTPPPELVPHVMDAGFVSEPDKHAAMAGAIAFCHPSVNESLGIVLLEAWMARTPALVHAGSAVLTHQCRNSGAGLWFRTYPEFEEELLWMLDHPAKRQAMGEAGRRYVLDQYAWPAVEHRLLAALDQ